VGLPFSENVPQIRDGAVEGALPVQDDHHTRRGPGGGPTAFASRSSPFQAGQAPRRRTADERFRIAVRGPLLGLATNLVLVVVKVFAGIASGSAALLADAGHSATDLINNLLVLGSLLYARRPADDSHPYGHDRAEVLAAVVSAQLLAAAAFVLGWGSAQKLIAGTPTPGLLALWVAVGTLVVKLVVTRVESAIARDVASKAVQADARDNFADVLSSFAVIVAVVGARLGEPRLDGLGGLLIAGLILWTAIQIARGAGRELLEQNLDADVLERVRTAAAQVPEVREVTAITGRVHGSDVLIELGIAVDQQHTVAEGAAIAAAVRRAVAAAIPEVGSVLVELNANHLRRLQRQLR
jgi:cation diffusion facilitator family transporter